MQTPTWKSGLTYNAEGICGHLLGRTVPAVGQTPLGPFLQAGPTSRALGGRPAQRVRQVAYMGDRSHRPRPRQSVHGFRNVRSIVGRLSNQSLDFAFSPSSTSRRLRSAVIPQSA